ncbi:MAG: polysaccharide biosynthesis/export family protein [Novosphingobium sp.]
MDARIGQGANAGGLGTAVRLGTAVSLAIRCVAVAGAMLLAGCESRGGKLAYDPPGFDQPDHQLVTNPAYDIPLGPLDIVRINVFRVAEISGEYQVDGAGLVKLPLIGEVSVRDQNASQFGRTLEKIYSAKYLNNPDITVRVVNTNQLNVTIEGGVNAPGIYALPNRTTLLGAIALAKGVVTGEANPKRVGIFRKRDGKTLAAAFDIVSIRHGEMVDPQVYPGDTIVVDGSKTRAIYRDILSTLPMIAVFRSL